MFLRYNLYTIVWATIIILLVLMPGSQMAQTDVMDFDKFAHAFVFCILTFLMIIGFTKQSTYPVLRDKAVRYSLYISISYALLLETCQLLVSGRMVEIFDAVANVFGCLLGFVVFYGVYKLKIE